MTVQKLPPGGILEKSILANFEKFTSKTPVPETVFNNCKFKIIVSGTGVFPVNFAKLFIILAKVCF